MRVVLVVLAGLVVFAAAFVALDLVLVRVLPPSLGPVGRVAAWVALVALPAAVALAAGRRIAAAGTAR